MLRSIGNQYAIAQHRQAVEKITKDFDRIVAIMLEENRRVASLNVQVNQAQDDDLIKRARQHSNNFTDKYG